jgi:nicotinate-nucleotide adenylyltransferase
MLRLALEGEAHFRLDTREIDRAGPTYTVDTIRELKQELAAGDELFFILGADSLAELPKWREPETLIRLCCLVAVPRPGYSFPDQKALEGAIPGIGRRVIRLDAPNIDISATEIRDRLARGASISDLVPGPVADYIREHGLYRD